MKYKYIKPLDVLKEVYRNTSPGGHVVIAESSRLMVPFKKSLKDLLNNAHPADVHPFYFSEKSLSALLNCAGFEVVYKNRFFDSDAIVIIGKKNEEEVDFLKEVQCDSPELVKEFFSKHHSLTEFFEGMR